MAIELVGVADWLYDTLTGDATLAAAVGSRVYDEQAPQNATFPFIVFAHSGSSDTTGVAANRIFVRGTWIVKVVDESESYSTIRAVADRIDAVLQRASGTAGSTRVYACSRQAPFRQREDADGRHYRSLGGLYRIVAQ